MAEYIEREQARQVICGWCEYDSCLADDYYWDKCDAKRRLGDIPTADVQPVVHRKWERHSEPSNLPIYFTCENCGAVGLPTFNYCPNCGAKMDEGG